MNIFSVFLLLHSANFAVGNFILPENYEKCSISSADFEECALSPFQKLITNIIQGIPSLDMPTLDPITIPRAFFEPASKILGNMILDLTNVTVVGYSKMKILSVKGTNITENVIRMENFVPFVKVTANFSITGNILRIPLAADGITDIYMKNMTLWYKSVHEPTKRDGKTYLTVKNIWINQNIKAGNIVTVSSKKKSLLSLSDNDINRILNQNFMALYDEYKPIVNKIIMNILSPSMKKFHDAVAMEDLFLS